MRVLGAVLAAVVIVGVACSDATGGGGGGRSTTITVSNNFFSPTPDTVSPGQVTFSWSNAGNSHNVTWDSGPSTPANSLTQTSGTHVVTVQTGTYHYHCGVHPGTMTGIIVVE